MRISFALLHHAGASADADPQRHLRRFPMQRELPLSVARRGHEVDVVHLHPTAATLIDEGVRHHFVPSPAAARAGARLLGRLSAGDPARYEPALPAILKLRALAPQVIHFHGLGLTWNLALLTLALGRSPARLVVQDHGGPPAGHPLARPVQRWALARAARVLFTAAEHARPFVDAGLVVPGAVVEMMETSSTFQPGDRAQARRETDMPGDPVFLWAGRLDPLKDPLTALRAFERIAGERPAAQLYLHYLTDRLLPELRAFVAARPPLAGRVHFRGRVPAERMEPIYRSADFLLQGSLKEVSGLAVLEAMACGVIPAVTDIPSFRAMTDGGRVGVLFPPGDAGALARGVLALSPAGTTALAAAARAWFERTLSYPALGARLEALYAKLLGP
jgi:glycosyltransferase involved in cell wall biosynthesis